MIKEINEANFQNEVLDSDRPVVLDFWTNTCLPCRALQPIIEKFANENEEVNVCKINAFDNPELARKYAITGVPTLLFFKDGEEKQRIVGICSESELKENVEQLI